MPTQDNSIAINLSLPEAFALACKATGPFQIHVKHRTSGREQAFTVNLPFVFIGRSPAVGVRLDDPSISQCHAYLQIIEGIVFCTDLGSRNGVVWDDGSQGRGWVRSDQTLRIGIFDVQIEVPPLSSTHNPADPYHTPDPATNPVLTSASVEIHSPTHTSAGIQSLDRPITLLGRHPSCDLRLLDEPLAYFQCAFVNTADGLWFVDTMSRQGAVLNGRNTRLARVRDADLMEFGKVSLVFRIGAHSRGSRLVLGDHQSVPTAIDTGTVISGKIAEAMAGAFVPIGEMVKQFQQCFVSMAQMFTSMQQEHAMLVSEQMRQIQELANEVRELRTQVRGDGTLQIETTSSPSTPAPPSPTKPPPPSTVEQSPPTPRPPTLNLPLLDDAQTFPDAHSWFTQRLTNKDQTPPAGS